MRCCRRVQPDPLQLPPQPSAQSPAIQSPAASKSAAKASAKAAKAAAKISAAAAKAAAAHRRELLSDPRRAFLADSSRAMSPAEAHSFFTQLYELKVRPPLRLHDLGACYSLLDLLLVEYMDFIIPHFVGEDGRVLVEAVRFQGPKWFDAIQERKRKEREERIKQSERKADSGASLASPSAGLSSSSSAQSAQANVPCKRVTDVSAPPSSLNKHPSDAAAMSDSAEGARIAASTPNKRSAAPLLRRSKRPVAELDTVAEDSKQSEGEDDRQHQQSQQHLGEEGRCRSHLLNTGTQIAASCLSEDSAASPSMAAAPSPILFADAVHFEMQPLCPRPWPRIRSPLSLVTSLVPVSGSSSSLVGPAETASAASCVSSVLFAPSPFASSSPFFGCSPVTLRGTLPTRVSEVQQDLIAIHETLVRAAVFPRLHFALQASDDDLRVVECALRLLSRRPLDAPMRLTGAIERAKDVLAIKERARKAAKKDRSHVLSPPAGNLRHHTRLVKSSSAVDAKPPNDAVSSPQMQS